MIDILYFASLRESLGSEREQLELNDELTRIDELKQLLASRGGIWTEVFTQQAELLVSVNQQMANDQSALNDGDEVAFFPPVTGG